MIFPLTEWWQNGKLLVYSSNIWETMYEFLQEVPYKMVSVLGVETPVTNQIDNSGANL